MARSADGTAGRGLPAGRDLARGALARTGGRALGGAAVVVAAATLASKLLGFVRDTTLADRFASTSLTDAYYLAALLPLVLFAAVGVSIQTVFIPLFASLLTESEPAAAERFAANVNGAVTVTVGALIIGMEAAAGSVVRAIVPTWWPPGEQALCIELVRIMTPLILFYAWSGVVGGILNVRGFFGPNAAMGIPQNLIIIGAILAGSLHGRQVIQWVAWGGLVGTCTTYLVQLPALRTSGYRLRWRLDLRDPLLRRMGRLVLPAALTALAQQTGTLFIYILGSRLPTGLISDFTYALRLQLLAYAILGMAVATVVYPSLATAAGTADMALFRRTLVRGLGLVNAVTVPVVAGLFLLRLPVVQVAFLHGRFTLADAAATARPLAFLSLGTLAFGWQDYLNRAFFALQDTRTPMMAAMAGVLVTIGLAFLLYGSMGLGGLGLAMALGWSSAVAVLAIRLRARLGLLGGRRLVASAAGMVLAGLLGFAPARVIYPILTAHLGGRWADHAGALVVCGAGAAVVYALVGAILRVPELGSGLGAVRGMVGRLLRAG